MQKAIQDLSSVEKKGYQPASQTSTQKPVDSGTPSGGTEGQQTLANQPQSRPTQKS